MNILTFDTIFDKTYITLTINEKIVDSITVKSDNEKYHSAYLISNLAKVLKKNNLQMSDIDKLATNIGPGSFTGIRVCLTVAKIMSQQLKIDVYGFTSPEILAQLNDSNTPTLVILDARRTKYYIGAFDENKKELFELKTYTFDELLKFAADTKYYIICDKSVRTILSEKGISYYCFEDNEVDLGQCLAKLAIAKSKAADSKNFDWTKLNPLYIQPPPISVSCKK